MTATRSASGRAAISRYAEFVSNGCNVHCRPSMRPDRARRHLSRHRHTVGVRRREQLELPAPAVAAHLHERERQRPSRLFGHAAEDRELGVDIGEVGDDLQHAPTRLADRPRDADQLVGVRRERRRVVALARAVVERPRRREPERTGFDCLASEPGHRLDVALGRGFASRSSLPHHVQPQRAVRHLNRDVDVERPTVERVHELGETTASSRRDPRAGPCPGMSSTPSISSMSRW